MNQVKTDNPKKEVRLDSAAMMPMENSHALEMALSKVKRNVREAKQAKVAGKLPENPQKLDELRKALDEALMEYRALNVLAQEMLIGRLLAVAGQVEFMEGSSEWKFQNFCHYNRGLMRIQPVAGLVNLAINSCDLCRLGAEMQELSLRLTLDENECRFLRVIYRCLEVKVALIESGWMSTVRRLLAQAESGGVATILPEPLQLAMGF